MIYILLLFCLLNVSIYFAIYFNRKIEETFFLSIICNILILFLSGVLFNLAIGFYIIMIGNIVLLFHNIYTVTRRWQLYKSNIFTVGMIVLVVTYLLFIWINYDHMLSEWDEFSHWGLVVKNMYLLNDFGLGSDSTVLAKNYLSGTALFQYFCMKLNGGFNESILYLAMNMTAFSMILPIFKTFKSIKQFSLYIIWFILICIPTLFYNNFYSSLYVDALLGIAFAYLIYSYYFNYEEHLNKFNVINIMASFAMIIFIKDIGLIFALIAFAIILIDNIAIRHKFILNFRSLWNKSKSIILVFIPCLLIKMLWTFKLSISNITTSLSVGGNILDGLFSVFSLSGYKYDVAYNFVRALFVEKLFGINVSYIVLIGLFIIMSHILISNVKDKTLKNSYIILSIVVILGAIGYAFFLLITYISIFSEYEALRLASFHRYVNSFAIGMSLLIFTLLLNKYSIIKRETIKLSLIFLTITLLIVDFSPLVNMTFCAREVSKNTIEIKSNYIYFKGIVDNYVKKDERIYFVSTNDNGNDFYIARYEVTPIKMNLKYAWSLGKPYDENDIWTIYKTPADWRDELIDSYDYVYLFDIDEQYVLEYGSVFDVPSDVIEDNQLYKVNKSSTNSFVLELITVSND